MAELNGGLIHMTAHMVLTEGAGMLILAGILVAVLFGGAAIIGASSKGDKQKWRFVAVFAAIALAGVVMAVAGAKQPRRKVIYCCASGPINLETVATRYDIIEVDGAFIKIAER